MKVDNKFGVWQEVTFKDIDGNEHIGTIIEVTYKEYLDVFHCETGNILEYTILEDNTEKEFKVYEDKIKTRKI